jgi:amidase
LILISGLNQANPFEVTPCLWHFWLIKHSLFFNLRSLDPRLNTIRSTIRVEDLRVAAAELNIEIPHVSDEEDYLHLLQSVDAVMRQIEASEDYLHPALSPVETTHPRTYWQPEIKDNPANAWRYRCELMAASPTSDTLKGRTVAIKDSISIGGLPTTVGTFTEVLCKDGNLAPSPIDASVVSRILESGATIKGSSTCENYCASPLSFSAATGPVHNAWMYSYTSGGSSSGSATLVAATAIHRASGKDFGETVELAIGGDQAGSVRIPASYSGIYGMKPTYGLVPYTGAVPLAPMIDHLGPLATNLEDIALLLQVITGYDGIDPRMTPESPLRGQVQDYPKLLSDFRSSTPEKEKLGSGLNIGLLRESFNIAGLSNQVRDTVLETSRSFFTAAGAEVIDISVPMHHDGSLIWTAATRMSMSEWSCQGKTSGYLSFLPPHIQAQWPPDQRMYELLTATNPAVVNIMLSGPFLKKQFGSRIESKAHRKAFELRAAYDKVFEGIDILVTPCAPTVAMPHPKMQSDAEGPAATVMEKLSQAVGVTTNTAPFNVTGHPALNVPCGFGSATDRPDVKLPIGMQIIGRRWEDALVLKAAAVFEAGRELVKQA